MVIETRIRKALKNFRDSNLNNFEYCSEDKIFVIDEDKSNAHIIHNSLTDDEKQKAFTIKNINGKNICVLTIDKGLFSKGHCDFATFDENTKIAFVEMKMNSDTDSLYTQNKHRIKSLEQISNTLRTLNQYKVILNEFTKEAILCLPSKFPAIDTTQLYETIKFIDEFEIIPKQTNEMQFE